MSEFAEAQGTNPVIAMPPVLGGLAVNASAHAKPRSVSADSFRKLTALLKKPESSPPPMPVVVAAAVPPEPMPVVVAAAVPPVPSFQPEPPPSVAAPVLKPEPEQVTAPPAFGPGPPPVKLAPAPVALAPVAIAPQPEPVLSAPEPMPEPMPEPVFAAPAPPPFDTSALATTIQPEVPRPRLKPRDEFAQSASNVPPRPEKPAPVQTPGQELEAAELARSLLDMMSASNSNGLPQERALAADTLLRLLPRLPLKSLLVLAERLCLMDNPPQLIVAKLISDPRIEVSGRLLEECSHITDEVLIAVINEGLPAKRRMLARRRKINRAVAAQLVQTGDPSVLLTLVRNASAEIPHESFIDLVHFASQQSDLLAPLCTRQDLPLPFAFELFWFAPAQLRRYLLSRFLTDSETLTKILKIALVGNSDESTSNSFPDPETIKAALQMAADGKMDEAAAALAEAAQINAATAERILNDRQGDSLAALFKAVGVPRVVAGEMLALAATTILDPTRDPDELPSLFGSLSFNKARILLTYWDWATLQSGPYAPLN